MSDAKEQKSNEDLAEEIVSLKPMTELVIDNDDSRTIIDFFSTFKLKMPDGLKQALVDFDQSLLAKDMQDQLDKMNKVKVELAKAMTLNADNPIFQKRPFDLALACSKRLSYHATLDEQLENSFKE